MTTYYVSTSGNDTTNNGTSLLTPFRTPAKAAGLVLAGDTVYIRGGTYSGAGLNPNTAALGSGSRLGWLELTRAGTAQAPIIWTNYNNEVVIFDGLSTYPNVQWDYGLIQFQGGCQYNYVNGIRLVNSGEFGFKIQGTFNRITNCSATYIYGMAMYCPGNDNLIEDCVFSESLLYYAGKPAYNAGQYNWGSAVACGRNIGVFDAQNRQITYRCTMRRVTSFHNRGEGINLWECAQCVMEDCVIYDNFAVNMYLSNAEYCTLQRNLVYATSYSDTSPVMVGRARGIGISNEVAVFPAGSSSPAPQMNNCVIQNNIVMGTGGNWFAFYMTQGSPGSPNFTNISIINNTFVNSGPSNMGWTGGPNIKFASGNYTGCRFANNIIIQDPGANLIVDGISGSITRDHNIWSQSQSILVGTGDYTGDPQLARTGWDGNGGTLTKEYFRPIAGSVALGMGAVISGNTVDYEGVTRSNTTPTAGALETPVGGSGVTDWSNTITPWTSTVVGDTYAAAVIQRSQSTNAIKIISSGGSDIYGTADGFSAGYQSASGDFDVRCRIQSATGGAQYAKVGIDIRQELTVGSAHYGLMKQRNTPGSDVLTMYQYSRYTEGGTTSQTLVSSSESINWVRSRRIGSMLEFMYSSDGTTWTTQSSITLSGWPETVYVCLSVCSASLSSATTAILDNVSMVQSLPSPWVYSDVGTVGVTGSAQYNSGTYTVYSGGDVIWTTADAFGFVNRQKTGDFDLRVRVPTGPSNTSAYAKAGLMVRSTMAVGASCICIHIRPGGDIEVLYRPYPDGSNAAFLANVVSGAKYLRITRAGNTFSAYYSTDGSSWSSLGSQLSITMPSTAYVGTYVHSNDTLYLSSATFDNLSIVDSVATQANVFFMDL
jgi:parallel beta-helix repeat protein